MIFFGRKSEVVTSMASPRIIFCLLLLLLAVVYSVSEVEHGLRHSQIGDRSGQRDEILLKTALANSTILETTINTTKDSSDNVVRIGLPGLFEQDEKDKTSQSEVDNNEEEEDDKQDNKEKEEKENNEENDEEGNEEYESENDDDDVEYEDELKAIAESHEKMSKDEARNSNISSVGNEQIKLSERKLSSAKNFDSHEKSNENVSDKDMSNMANTSEKVHDEEVLELLKYKMERSVKAKTKRVPTVKKELSTQKEILLASNETHVPKSLLPSEDLFNRLRGKTDSIQRRSLEGNEVQEIALAKNLLKLLVKLTDDPSRWQRVHKFLTNTENLYASKSSQDPVKRNYDAISSTFSTTPVVTDAPKKNRKESKKKKKRPKNQRTSTAIFTTTITPESSPTMTEIWSTPQWRLLIEKLFGLPWQQDIREEPENLTKTRSSALDSKLHTLSIWDFIDQKNIQPKNILRTINTERTPLLDVSRESGSQSLPLRFGKMNTYQPLHLQEFTPSYDLSEDSNHAINYYSSEAAYLRLHYIPSREFLQHRNENDYQDDLTPQADNFAYNQKYKPSSREFASSKSSPDFSYKHSRSWSSDERPLVPMSTGKWPWGQQGDLKYWPERGRYMDRNYWMTLDSTDEGNDRTDQSEIEEWQQQRLPFWEIDRSNFWPIEETLKISSLWPQMDRNVKIYDQSTTWERNKNHSELNKKQDMNNKVVLPKITMKTWNSLTSDPATWPYKLPSAKPWPKDENGKSYNPNADLVKKLGLDKDSNMEWLKDQNDKTGRLVYEKQINTSPFKDMSKKKELARLNDFKYKSISNKSNYSDYKKSQHQDFMKETSNWMYQNVKQPKEWVKSQTVSSLPKNDEIDTWNRKSEMSAVNQPKPVNDENSSFSRFWPLNTISSNKQKWSDNNSVGLMESWKDNTKHNNLLGTAVNNGNFWKEKSNNSWLSKTKEDTWATRIKSAPNSWDSKISDNNSWTSKINNDASWMSLKSNDAGSWTMNGNIWAGKFKDNNVWAKFDNIAWKNNDDNWPRKIEQNSWQQKINDDWNIGYSKNSASTWPSKWKQFAYHKVTAMPISKPGTTADVSSPKFRNAFVAVSAISSSSVNNGNDWQRNDAEDTIHEDSFRLEEANQSSNQIRLDRPIYAWKKGNFELNNNRKKNNNSTELLENQLEELRQDDFWPYKENENEMSEESVYITTSTAQSATMTNFTTTSPRDQIISSKTNEKPRHLTYQ